MTDFIAVAIADLQAGAALDWAVAKAVGIEADILKRLGKSPVVRTKAEPEMFWSDYSPSTDWSQGGPIIETMPNGNWLCYRDFYRFSFSLDDGTAGYGQGKTMLESAMKALVGKKFGDAVLVPKALVERV